MHVLKIHFLSYVLLSLIILLAWLWGALALFYAGPASAWRRYTLLALFITALPVSFYFAQSYWQGVILVSIIFTVLMLWWWSLVPTNDKDWQSEVARLVHGEINGDVLTLHNVRNFKYRTRDDFDEHWETRRYDLSQICSLDLFMSYWGLRHIAHTILSWGFENGDHLVISIETRKSVGQSYSSIQGFFKQFNLIYIAADERDLIRLRTNIRREEVYLYPLVKVPPQRARALLESYLRHMNELAHQAEFYHALSMNCTSAITLHTKIVDPDVAVTDWRLFANGHIDEMLYEHGSIRTDLPFAEVRKLSRVDQLMQQRDGTDFSAQLREKLVTQTTNR